MASNQHKPKWTIDDLTKALDEVKNGAPKRSTAEKYGIPWSTFCDKASGRRKIEQHQKTVLTAEEERDIVTYVKQMGDRGFGKTKDELLSVVKQMLDYNKRETIWDENKPSDKWFRLFRKRHPEIVFRKPQLLGKQRAVVSRCNIMTWFQEFREAIMTIDPSILLEPDRIYNCDESGFSLNAVTGRVLSNLGTKFVYQIGSEAKTLITALVCCSATGHYTWPMLIYPGTQFRGFKPNEVFNDSFIGRSENGWINQGLFFEWMRLVFIPQTANVKKPILLLVDGHVSHQSLQVSELCRDNGVVLYCLPPHSSHILQPLDVGVFKTMKGEWKTAVKAQNESEIITKRTFAKTFKMAYEATVSKSLTESAFRKCGIYPYDPENIDWSKVTPSTGATDPATNVQPVATTAPHVPPVTANTWNMQPVPVNAPSVPPVPVNAPCVPPVPVNAPSVPPVAVNAPSVPPVAVNAPCVPPVPVNAPRVQPMSANALQFIAHSSSAGDVHIDLASVLQKFAMICAQIGDATLNQYYTRLEEGYDCDDSLYSLWKSYNTQLLSALQAQATDSGTAQQDSTLPGPSSCKQGNPLALPVIKRGAKRTKALKMPALISSPDFREMIIQKEIDQKEEEARKVKRKLDMEEKRKAKAQQEEEKKAKREERKKLQEERKRKKEMEIQLRKEERKRKMEEKKKSKAQKRPKLSKKKEQTNNPDSDSATSVDESEMILDDNSLDEVEIDCFQDDSEAEERNFISQAGNSEIEVNPQEKDNGIDIQEARPNARANSNSNNNEHSTTEMLNEFLQSSQPDGLNDTRNIWIDLAVDHIV